MMTAVKIKQLRIKLANILDKAFLSANYIISIKSFYIIFLIYIFFGFIIKIIKINIKNENTQKILIFICIKSLFYKKSFLLSQKHFSI